MRKAGLSTRERELVDEFVARDQAVVTADDVLALVKGSRSAANATLSRLARKGWLQRLKRGSYAVVQLGVSAETPILVKGWPIAAELFRPCFISGWSAAEHWGLTDQIFNVLSLVTTRRFRSRDQRIGSARFRLRMLSSKRVFGTTKIWFGSIQVPIADPHRMMIDILDAPEFGGGGRHMLDIARSYWLDSRCDPDKLLAYARQFGRGTVFKRLGLIAEQYGSPSEEWIRQCIEGCTQGISLLDPGSPNSGPIRSRWNLRVNIPMEQS